MPPPSFSTIDTDTIVAAPSSLHNPMSQLDFFLDHELPQMVAALFTPMNESLRLLSQQMNSLSQTMASLLDSASYLDSEIASDSDSLADSDADSVEATRTDTVTQDSDSVGFSTPPPLAAVTYHVSALVDDRCQPSFHKFIQPKTTEFLGLHVGTLVVFSMVVRTGDFVLYSNHLRESKAVLRIFGVAANIPARDAPVIVPFDPGPTAPSLRTTIRTSLASRAFRLSWDTSLRPFSPNTTTSLFYVDSNLLPTLWKDAISNDTLAAHEFFLHLSACHLLFPYFGAAKFSGYGPRASNEYACIASGSNVHKVFDEMPLSGHCYFSFPHGSFHFTLWDTGEFDALGKGFPPGDQVTIVPLPDSTGTSPVALFPGQIVFPAVDFSSWTTIITSLVLTSNWRETLQFKTFHSSIFYRKLRGARYFTDGHLLVQLFNVFGDAKEVAIGMGPGTYIVVSKVCRFSSCYHSDFMTLMVVAIAESLLTCVEQISYKHVACAGNLLSQMESLSSETTKPVEHVAHFLAETISQTIDKATGRVSSYNMQKLQSLFDPTEVTKEVNPALVAIFNKPPVGQVSIFTAAQAIIENAIEAKKIHVVDLNIRTHLQRSVLRQVHQSKKECLLESLKINATISGSTSIDKDTGKPLMDFDQCLSMPFSSNVVIVSDMLYLREDLFEIEPVELVAVYLPLALGSHIHPSDQLKTLMRVVSAINPMVAKISQGIDILSLSLEDFLVSLYDASLAIGSFRAREKEISVLCASPKNGPATIFVDNKASWIASNTADTLDITFTALAHYCVLVCLFLKGQFIQWDPGGCSLVPCKEQSELGVTWVHVIIDTPMGQSFSLSIVRAFDLEDKINLKGWVMIRVKWTHVWVHNPQARLGQVLGLEERAIPKAQLDLMTSCESSRRRTM